MKKFIIFLFLISSFLLVSCDKEKPALFLSSEKLTQNNFSLDKTAKSFNVGQKIWFLFYYPKEYQTNILRVQILKLTVLMPIDGFSMAMARDIEIDTNNPFVTDSFVLHKDGTYLLRIFTRDQLYAPVIQQEFTINPK
ncbi:MAG: hypothetical protein WCK67_02975 [bacterium]